MTADGVSTDACIKLIKQDMNHVKSELKNIKDLLVTKVDKPVCFEREKVAKSQGESLKQLQRFVWGVLASTVLLLVSIILTNVWSK